MPWLPAVATVVSAGLTVYGAIKQSRAENELGAATAQAQIDQGVAQRDAAIQEQRNLLFNAQVQRNQADVERVASARDVSIFREEGEALKGRQITQLAAAGLGAGGSVALILEDTANKISDDLQQLTFAGRSRVRAIEAGAEITEREAASRRRAGDIALRTSLRSSASTRRQARTRASTSLLTGALSATGTILTGFERSRRLRTRRGG